MAQDPKAGGPVSTAGGDVHDWGPLVGDLAARRERALEMGGADRVVRQRELGKLTVRERLDLLLDPGTWVEYSLLADHMDAGIGDRYLAADGAITGVGEIADERSPVVARVGHGQRPFHCGARFSANAATPSAASSVCEVTVNMPWRYASAASASISSTR